MNLVTRWAVAPAGATRALATWCTFQKLRHVSVGAIEKEFLLGSQTLDCWTSSWTTAKRLNNTLSTFSPGGLAGRLAQECELKARGAATGCSRYFLLTLMTADLLILVPFRLLSMGFKKNKTNLVVK